MCLSSSCRFFFAGGLIDHQYAKFAAWYRILIDSAILKSMIFDDVVDFVDLITNDLKRELFFRKSRKSEAGQNYFGKRADGQNYFGKFWTDGGEESPVKSTGTL